MKIVDQLYYCQLPDQVFGVWQLQCHLRIFLSQVTFDWHNGQASNPHWNEIAPETVQALISKDVLLV